MGARISRFTAILAVLTTTASFQTPLRAWAAVAAASSTPASVTVASQGPATVRVTWHVVRVTTNLPNPATVSSPNVRILLGGDQIATLQRPLARKTSGLVATEMLTIKEVLHLPSTVIYRAVKQGGALRVLRKFVDSSDGVSETAELEVVPGGPAAAGVSVTRLALSFDDGSRVQTVQRAGELRVRAELNTSGIGLIAGQWEVASGSTSAGTPVFRPLSLVRQGVAGGGRTVITSPPLPTSEGGAAFVRLRLTDPAPDFEIPTLEYYVLSGGLARASATPRDILIAAPRPGVELTAETRFAWTPIDGAKAYRLAFFAKADNAPLAGLFVRAGKNEAIPERFTLDLLPGGRSYLWQVTAIDGNGAVVGSSPKREIYKP